MSSWDAYNKMLDGYKAGEIVSVRLYRGHRLLTMNARLTAFPYMGKRPRVHAGAQLRIGVVAVKQVGTHVTA